MVKSVEDGANLGTRPRPLNLPGLTVRRSVIMQVIARAIAVGSVRTNPCSALDPIFDAK